VGHPSEMDGQPGVLSRNAVEAVSSSQRETRLIHFCLMNQRPKSSSIVILTVEPSLLTEYEELPRWINWPGLSVQVPDGRRLATGEALNVPSEFNTKTFMVWPDSLTKA
jgi:hypothetical protein